MTYITVSHWNIMKWTAEMEATARDKFVPLIMSVGAEKVQMLRTRESTFCVVTEYVNAAKLEAAEARISELRAQAADELLITWSAHMPVKFTPTAEPVVVVSLWRARDTLAPLDELSEWFYGAGSAIFSTSVADTLNLPRSVRRPGLFRWCRSRE